MPRGAKKDITVTKNLREAGFLQDPRSFISLDGHLFLKGCDKGNIRYLVFKKHKNRCVVCKAPLDIDVGLFDVRCGNWHHPKKCDCVGCSELRCDTTTGRPCHAHGTVGFQRQVIA